MVLKRIFREYRRFVPVTGHCTYILEIRSVNLANGETSDRDSHKQDNNNNRTFLRTFGVFHVSFGGKLSNDRGLPILRTFRCISREILYPLLASRSGSFEEQTWRELYYFLIYINLRNRGMYTRIKHESLSLWTVYTE